MTITTTGQRAQITQSIIAGQPRAVSVVDVVGIDGDTLTYTTDGVWRSTATRSPHTDWEIVNDFDPATIRVPREWEGFTAHAKSLRFVVDAAETINNLCVDYLDRQTMKVDLDGLRREPLADIRRTLAELDAIVADGPSIPFEIGGGLLLNTIERSRTLAAAIRQAAAEIVGAGSVEL
jgi:hypothetical protein